MEPILSYGAFTYPDLAEVTSVLHHLHARMLRYCLGLPWSNTEHSNHKPTEWLYYGLSKLLGRTRKSSVLTLPAMVMRQSLSALGHWTRDNYYRNKEAHATHLRCHPVIDVLRFDPSLSYAQRAGGRMPTIRDAYQSAVRYAGDNSGGDLLKTTVLTSRGSRCANKHEWYNASKARVKEMDAEILQSAMMRRLADGKREFGQAQYDTAMHGLRNDRTFTLRWLTAKTRDQPLGEDREFAKERLRRRN